VEVLDEPEILRVSDERTGHLEMTQVATGQHLRKDMLDKDDVFLVNSGTALYVWIGSGASVDERKQAMTYAHNYLQTKSNPLIPVTVISEGNAQKSQREFDAIFEC